MKKRLLTSLILTTSLITTSQIFAIPVSAKVIRKDNSYEATHPTWFGDVPIQKEDVWSDEKYLTWLENSFYTVGESFGFMNFLYENYKIRDSAIPGLKLKIQLHAYTPVNEARVKKYAEANGLDFNALSNLNDNELNEITDSVGLDFDFVKEYMQKQKMSYFPATCYGWAKNSQDKWYYSDNNANWETNTWKKIDGAWYYFDEKSQALTGWNLINHRWYYFYDNCSMAHDCVIKAHKLASSGELVVPPNVNQDNLQKYDYILLNGK